MNVVPDGHELRTLRGGIDPILARLPGGLLVACTGLGGDDQVAEVTALVDGLATQIAPHVVHVTDELFAAPTRELSSAAVIYLQARSLDGFSDDALDNLAHTLRGLPTTLTVYADGSPDVMRLATRLDGVRAPSDDGTFVVEARRPDGSIATGLVTGTLSEAAADPEAPLARSPRLAALVLALTDEPTVETKGALDDYLVTRTASLALIATKGPSGKFGISPRSWQDKRGLVAYGDERTLHRSAHELGLLPGSYAVAAMPPKKLFAWAVSLDLPVMLCAFDDRPNGTQSAWHAAIEVADLKRLGT